MRYYELKSDKPSNGDAGLGGDCRSDEFPVFAHAQSGLSGSQSISAGAFGVPLSEVPH